MSSICSVRLRLVLNRAADPGADAGRSEIDAFYRVPEFPGIKTGVFVEGDRDELTIEVFFGCGNALQAL